jgi:hypothetical protein
VEVKRAKRPRGQSWQAVAEPRPEPAEPRFFGSGTSKLLQIAEFEGLSHRSRRENSHLVGLHVTDLEADFGALPGGLHLVGEMKHDLCLQNM